MILAGDIGGTKTVIGLYEETGGDRLSTVREETFKSGEFTALEQILTRFLDGSGAVDIRSGCFGIAGAVIEGRCRTTNLPWTELEELALARHIGAKRVKLLNDLESAAFGMLYLAPNELDVLNEGSSSRKGNVAVLAAGTGLGEAILHWDGSHHHPLASEGGHCDFAPRNEVEDALLVHLRDEFGGHVSYERILSGPGFFNVYKFLRDTGRYEEPAWLTEKLKTGDPSAIASQVGLRGESELCVAALDLFSEIYGAEAGNVALKCIAVGGVFIGGGIAPKMLPTLKNGSFLKGFLDKGRFRSLMESLPVKVALNPKAPLIGAAHYAIRL